MTTSETGMLIRIISAAYPNYSPVKSEKAAVDAIDLWQTLFNEYPFELVAWAVREFIKHDTEGFPPVPGEIMGIINDAIGKKELTGAEAWNRVILAIRNGAYGADEEFAKLPEDVQKAIGGSHYIHELALSQNVNWGLESNNFYRHLEEVRERKKNLEDIPDAVQNLIDQMNQVKQEQLENGQEVARLEQKNYYDDLSERTMEKFLTEEREELTEGQKGFADMLRERLGMPKKEDTLPDEYSAEYYYDSSQDNKEDGWEGELFA